MTAGVATRGNWTDERLATLKRCFSRGDSFSQIAQELGEGCTKNAALGKAARLGLIRKPVAEPGAARVRDFCIPKGSRPKPAPIPDKDTRRKLVLAASNAGVAAPTFRAAKPVPGDIAIAPRHWITREPRECAWPHDGVGYDVRSCCNKTMEGPYCPGHSLWAFNEQPSPSPIGDASRFDGRVLQGRKVAAA